MENDPQKKSPYSFLFGMCSAEVFLFLIVQNYPRLYPFCKKNGGCRMRQPDRLCPFISCRAAISMSGTSVLTDWISTKKVFIYSCIATACAALLFALFARSYTSALFLRGLIGLAIGGTYTPRFEIDLGNFFQRFAGQGHGLICGSGCGRDGHINGRNRVDRRSLWVGSSFSDHKPGYYNWWDHPYFHPSGSGGKNAGA